MLTDMAGGQIRLNNGGVDGVAIHSGQARQGPGHDQCETVHGSADVPTLDETASKGFDAVAWSALYAPPKTPEPVVDKINAAMREAAQALKSRNGWMRPAC